MREEEVEEITAHSSSAIINPQHKSNFNFVIYMYIQLFSSAFLYNVLWYDMKLGVVN